MRSRFLLLQNICQSEQKYKYFFFVFVCLCVLEKESNTRISYNANNRYKLQTYAIMHINAKFGLFPFCYFPKIREAQNKIMMALCKHIQYFLSLHSTCFAGFCMGDLVVVYDVKTFSTNLVLFLRRCDDCGKMRNWQLN